MLDIVNQFTTLLETCLQEVKGSAIPALDKQLIMLELAATKLRFRTCQSHNILHALDKDLEELQSIHSDIKFIVKKYRHMRYKSLPKSILPSR